MRGPCGGPFLLSGFGDFELDRAAEVPAGEGPEDAVPFFELHDLAAELGEWRLECDAGFELAAHCLRVLGRFDLALERDVHAVLLSFNNSL